MEALSIAGGILCDPEEGLGALSPLTQGEPRAWLQLSLVEFVVTSHLLQNCNLVLSFKNSDDCMKQCYYTNSLFEMQPT